MYESYHTDRLENPRGWSLRRVRRVARRRPYLTMAAGVGLAGAVGVGLYLLLNRYVTSRYVFTGPGGYLVINGRRHPVSAPTNHSLQFTELHPRTQAPRLGVLHVSEGEPVDGSGVYDTLVRRGLSVDYIIDRDGTIWVLNDPGRFMTLHAGRVMNPISWGVEIVGYGALGFGEAIPERGRARDTYQATVHGRQYTFGDLLPAQYAALEQLTTTVNGAFGIPRQSLVDPVGIVPSSTLQQIGGVVAHYHSSTGKTDPGPRTMEMVSRQPGWRGFSA